MTAADLVESLVNLVHGDSDPRIQHLFRQNLMVLVELAKMEGRREFDLDCLPETKMVSRGTMH